MRRERILAGMESGEEIENDWLVSPWKYKKKKKQQASGQRLVAEDQTY